MTNDIQNPSWESVEKLVASGKASEALFLLRRMVQEGHYDALVEIGGIYDRPSEHSDIEPDYKKAAHYYSKSIELADDKYAYLALARLYLFGKGVDQNYKKAKELYLKSSDRQCCIADLMLARMFRFGTGVEASKKLSMYYYDLAVERGSLIALRERGWINISSGHIFVGCRDFFKGMRGISKQTFKDIMAHGLIVSDSLKHQ